ncbi:hypothetical protein K490DRAFT_35263 [Saccharata proteae CBS 121410]|uniref:CHCH domain-containing protein n=1 Tax=Saccharata proteae CBS 121410 TaxID=1314787 RepID=A0A9P4HVL1_9PEZI|nr:hypothetical protein K490DRAFT_35263 [Saccharata proteae CBS 121410]
MPRQSRGSAPPRRPAVAPARPAVNPPQPAQSRPASTAAHPPAQQHAPQATPPAQQAQGSQGPGLFGQMASTAAGVAVGSSIGHAIGGFFGGSSAPAESAQAAAPATTDNYAQQSGTGVCATDIGNFRKCMDENQGSLTICGWYLDQLKACQAAASQY